MRLPLGELARISIIYPNDNYDDWIDMMYSILDYIRKEGSYKYSTLSGKKRVATLADVITLAEDDTITVARLKDIQLDVRVG